MCVSYTSSSHGVLKDIFEFDSDDFTMIEDTLKQKKLLESKLKKKH